MLACLQVLQLGTLAMIPYLGQLILETGLLRALINVFGQIVSGSLFFYIFQQQTVSSRAYANKHHVPAQSCTLLHN